MRILITGAKGMLAQDLAPVLKPTHEVLSLDHSACDISDEAAINRIFASWRPELVINCAAYSDVDACERDPKRAFGVNGQGAGNVAVAADAIDARVFHISTDYVFDGRQRTPYVEQDVPRPISLYGQSKMDGEQRTIGLRGGDHRHLIIRTSWLYGSHRTNFVDKVLERAQSNLPVEAVADQVSCLTWTSHLAQRISELVEIAPTGILHLTGSGPCTRFEIAQRIVEALPNPVVVSPIDWGKLNLPAKRPEYSAMESQRLAELGIQPLPHWKLALDEYLQLRKVVPVTAKGIKLGVEP